MSKGLQKYSLVYSSDNDVCLAVVILQRELQVNTMSTVLGIISGELFLKDFSRQEI